MQEMLVEEREGQKNRNGKPNRRCWDCNAFVVTLLQDTTQRVVNVYHIKLYTEFTVSDSECARLHGRSAQARLHY